MGHDIYGFNKKREDVSYLRFKFSNPLANVVYEALDASDANGVVGGNGVERVYTLEGLQTGMEKIKEIDAFLSMVYQETIESHAAKRFLRDCIETAEEEGEVSILFS